MDDRERERREVVGERERERVSPSSSIVRDNKGESERLKREEDQRRRRAHRSAVLQRKRLSVRHTHSPSPVPSTTHNLTNTHNTFHAHIQSSHSLTDSEPLYQVTQPECNSLTNSLSPSLEGLTASERRRVKNRLSAMKSREKVNDRLSVLTDSLQRLRDREQSLLRLGMDLATNTVPVPHVPQPELSFDVDWDEMNFDEIAFSSTHVSSHSDSGSSVCESERETDCETLSSSSYTGCIDEDLVSLSSAASSEIEEMLLFSEEIMRDLDLAIHLSTVPSREYSEVHVPASVWTC